MAAFKGSHYYCQGTDYLSLTEQGDSWVVERHRPGIGFGPDARPATREILVGTGKWVPKSTWDAAIRARKNGTATQKQKELLDHGHWKA